MNNHLSIVVPFRGAGDSWRGRAFEYVTDHLRLVFPDAELIVCDDPHLTFNRGRALNEGVRQAQGDVLILADADLWVPPAALCYAVTVATEYGMVVPFDHLIGLDGPGSVDVYGGFDPAGVWASERVELDWWRRSDGGCNVLTRAAFDTARGFCAAFAGWGGEDAAFASAVGTLSGHVGWVPARAVHLWHPTDPTRGTERTEANMELAQAFSAAWGNPAAMRLLIDGARV